ncbi:hypothetical protein ACQPU1_17755 [Clostridium paraputrificum]|uniref:hypothetical protein n=1 Tax=Clostridium paraputrificum TaxID=29363 RepID=UPI003D331E06
MGYTKKEPTENYYKYKEKYKIYKKLCNKLQDKYDDLMSYINYLDGYLSSLSSSYYDSGSLEGRAEDLFNEKCKREYTLLSSKISEFKNMSDSIASRLNSAYSKRDNYKNKRDYEEANPKITYVKWWWE